AFQHTPALAITLTMLFGTAATVFLILLLRRQPTTHQKTHHHTRTTRHATRTNHGLEAAGATIMALMFATMTT
ncbi:hypothetical protein ACIQC5_18865, partial [Paenarthrobacter sp. NPDC092416]|uniref:hypothetical protein n=1 Tax=Paenarthrobacter sp. NPDC092416 TaxID=3364386 RepID=UPI003817E922